MVFDQFLHAPGCENGRAAHVDILHAVLPVKNGGNRKDLVLVLHDSPDNLARDGSDSVSGSPLHFHDLISDLGGITVRLLKIDAFEPLGIVLQDIRKLLRADGDLAPGDELTVPMLSHAKPSTLRGSTPMTIAR